MMIHSLSSESCCSLSFPHRSTRPSEFSLKMYRPPRFSAPRQTTSIRIFQLLHLLPHKLLYMASRKISLQQRRRKKIERHYLGTLAQWQLRYIPRQTIVEVNKTVLYFYLWHTRCGEGVRICWYTETAPLFLVSGDSW